MWTQGLSNVYDRVSLGLIVLGILASTHLDLTRDEDDGLVHGGVGYYISDNWENVTFILLYNRIASLVSRIRAHVFENVR